MGPTAGYFAEKATDYAYIGGQMLLGPVQGGLNTLNGFQDAVIAIPNLAPLAYNVTAGNLGAPRSPYIPSPDWAKNKVVQNDPYHGASKFLGGQAAITLGSVRKLVLREKRAMTEIPAIMQKELHHGTTLFDG